MLTIPSVFLSHNSADNLLVRAVHRELGRRGILSWLEDLNSGLTLTSALTEAIRRQTVVAVFLSPESIDSPWVDFEMEVAFQVEEREARHDVVIPICLGSKLELVKSNDRLRRRLLTPDGQNVNRLCIVPEESDTDAMAVQIAQKLGQTIFRRLKLRSLRDVMIYMDQRGNEQRLGEPQDIPANLRHDIEVGGMVFRPYAGPQTQDETLYSHEWTKVRKVIEQALAEAIGGPRWNEPKRVYILGNGQSGLFYLLGRYFNRNTSARLYCSNANQTVLSNDSLPAGATQPSGGNAHCETLHSTITPIVVGSKYGIVSLMLGTEQYLHPVQRYLKARGIASPLLWVESGRFADSDGAMNYINDVVALVSRLRREHSVDTVRLFNTLPMHVVSLLAASFLHVIDNLIFMEYRRDLRDKAPRAEDTYAELEMC